MLLVFFFQAEDGIRDVAVTGVQTCALPISLTALPPGTVHGGIKITEQGEIVSQNFGLPSVAERSLELMLSGVLLHRFEDWRDGLQPGEEARFREIMDRLTAEALPRYRSLVYGSE